MYRITQVLSLGPFASPHRAPRLLGAGVTHVLNVSDGASAVSAGPGSFRAVEWVPITDLDLIPGRVALHAIDTLHRLASEPDSHVYVHCVAGQRRAPTVLWLYLVACGFPPDDARDLIEERAPDAVPGHPHLVDPELVLRVQKHGLMNFFPHPRGEVLVPFPTEEPRLDGQGSPR